jgi:hypothetical protein
MKTFPKHLKKLLVPGVKLKCVDDSSNTRKDKIKMNEIYTFDGWHEVWDNEIYIKENNQSWFIDRFTLDLE